MAKYLLSWLRGVGILASAACLQIPAAEARDLFQIRLTLPESGLTGESSFSSAEDVINEFERDFSSTLNAYTPTSVAHIQIDFRGVPINAAFPAPGPLLQVSIPQCGFNETFVGATRNDSINQFEDFLEQNNSDILTCVVQDAVANTPVDPLAGNPNSLMAKMAASDFAIGFDPDVVLPSEEGSIPDIGRLGLQFGHFFSGEFSGNNYTIPLRYSFNLDNGYGIVLDAPLNILSVSGSQAYSGSFGVGVRIPITEYWTLTPVGRAGAVGSVDFASASILYSGSVSSLVSFPISAFNMDLGNMFGFYQTGSVSVGDYESDYSLTNYLSRHGVRASAELPFGLFGEVPSLQIGLIRTDFFGDDLYVSGYTDIISSVGIPGRISGVSLERFRVGLTYTIGDEDFQSIRFGGAFRF